MTYAWLSPNDSHRALPRSTGKSVEAGSNLPNKAWSTRDFVSSRWSERHVTAELATRDRSVGGCKILQRGLSGPCTPDIAVHRDVLSGTGNSRQAASSTLTETWLTWQWSCQGALYVSQARIWKASWEKNNESCHHNVYRRFCRSSIRLASIECRPLCASTACRIRLIHNLDKPTKATTLRSRENVRTAMMFSHVGRST